MVSNKQRLVIGVLAVYMFASGLTGGLSFAFGQAVGTALLFYGIAYMYNKHDAAAKQQGATNQ